MRKTRSPTMCRGIDNLVFRQDSSSCRPSRQAHLLFNRDAQVLNKMEPVGYLLRLRCALTNGLGVQSAAIPTHDLDRGMLLKPVCSALDTAVFQNVDTERCSRSTTMVPSRDVRRRLQSSSPMTWPTA